MKRLAIVGAGAWGSALAGVATTRGVDTLLLSLRDGGVPNLGEAAAAVELTRDPARLAGCPVVILAIPTVAMRSVVTELATELSGAEAIVSAAKGFETGSGATMTEVMEAQLGAASHGRLAALSGPNIAPEVARGLPAATVIAAHEEATAAMVSELFAGSQLRCYTSGDVIGVQYAGALKNVVAIAAGICDGIGSGDNGKAAIITRGLAEVARLGIRAGAMPLTFAGLAGLGDCIVTCMSPHSRNRRVGELIGSGESLEMALAAVAVAEGVNTCRAAMMLAARHDVEMPIASAVHRVLFEGCSVGEALSELLRRDPADELRGLGLDRLDSGPPPAGSSSVG